LLGVIHVNASDQLRAGLSALPGVAQAPSRVGSQRNPAWFVAAREFAHLHSNSLLDLRLPLPMQSRLRNDPRAHFRRHSSAWVELEFHSAQDVADLLRLARQAAVAAKRPAAR
jgi:hypothetical protein